MTNQATKAVIAFLLFVIVAAIVTIYIHRRSRKSEFPFRCFVIAEGDGRTGFDMFTIRKDGLLISRHITRVARSTIAQRSVFQIPPDILSQFEKRLIDIDFFSLEQHYDSGVAD